MSTHPGTQPPDFGFPAEASQLYSPAWAGTMRGLDDALRDEMDGVIDRFCERLVHLAGPGMMIKSMSPADLADIKRNQVHNLATLLSPDLTEAEHHAIASHVGGIHAIVGVGRADLVHSHDLLLTEVRNQVDPTVHGPALGVLSRRMIRDLAWQAEAYTELQAARYTTLLRLTHLAWEAESFTDLITRSAQILSELREIDACSFGRPDESGSIRYEAIAGTEPITRLLGKLENTQDAPFIGHGRPAPDGVTRRAWLGGKVEHCINVATDPHMPPHGKALSEEAGLRSMACIPLNRPGQPPLAVLTLYCRLRGGYTSLDQTNFIAQLQTLLVFSISRLEHLVGPTHMVPYTQRQYWSSLLRTGALEMHYQPLLELKTGRVAKVEALARLRDGKGMLTPSIFFPALSSDDFVELYTLGLGQALAQRNRWLEDGLDLQISINLPSSALGDIRYFHATQRALGEHGCTPYRLTLEILETEEISPTVDVMGELLRFKALGVNLAEDDLGSGYSSLNRLRAFPFDAIKIDRSIVMNAGQDSSNVLRFIYQLTRLGHSLGKLVIVEGVENPDLLEAITILGADIVQGHAVASPMTAQELTRWMRQQTLPQIPDPQQPRSLLAKLARLLIWEEHLHLLVDESPERKKTAFGTLAARGAFPPRARVNRGDNRSVGEMEQSLPFLTIDPAMQQALILAAVNHGLRSTEYSQARQQLVLALISGN